MSQGCKPHHVTDSAEQLVILKTQEKKKNKEKKKKKKKHSRHVETRAPHT